MQGTGSMMQSSAHVTAAEQTTPTTASIKSLFSFIF
jgi:hypothetical protein